MGVTTKPIGKQSVIVVDCAGMSKEQSAQVAAILQEASAQVAKNPKKSVHIITNVTDVKFDNTISGAFKAYASANTPYVKESVIVGLGGMQTVIFSAIKAMTGRDFQLVKTMAEAESYMASV